MHRMLRGRFASLTVAFNVKQGEAFPCPPHPQVGKGGGEASGRGDERFLVLERRVAMSLILSCITLILLAFSGPLLAAPPKHHAVAVKPASGATLAARFAQAGADNLALGYIQDQQPAYSHDPSAWRRWERVRLQVLKTRQDWASIARQIASLPKGLTVEQRANFVTLGAQAELALDHGARARRLLRSLLWQGDAHGAQLRLWRRLLIESYLDDGLLDDARLALLNYQLDYSPDNAAERAVLARVWLRVHEPRRALELLSVKPRSGTYWLYWLASLRAGSLSAKTVLAQARKGAGIKGLTPGQAARRWGVAATAALEMGDWPAAVHALERFLALAPRLPLTPLLPFNGDTLWQAYRKWALQAGNRAKLLIGDGAAWEAAAREAQKSGHSALARAYNALLARTGQNTRTRETGYRWLGASLLAQKQGKRLLDRLFLSAPKRFPATTDIPRAIRLVLANDAVDRGSLALAARLMEGLNKPPIGENPYLWKLRLARVLILGGKASVGIERLQRLIAHQHSFDRKQADQLMQVLFDLQSTRKNAAAVKLFEMLYPKLVVNQQRRELLFWEAQSREALNQFARAARLYLRSAMLFNAQAYGPWGMAARYNAALALNKAGMTGDAIRVLRNLLGHTQNKSRIAVLKRKLAQLQRAAPQLSSP